MKKVLITVLLFLSFTAIAQAPKQDKKVSLILTVQEVEVVLDALQAKPYSQVAGIINSIYSQASKQIADTSKKK